MRRARLITFALFVALASLWVDAYTRAWAHRLAQQPSDGRHTALQQLLSIAASALPDGDGLFGTRRVPG
jgi:hypothetical protein